MEFGKSKPEWLEYDALAKYTHVAHGTFLRHGGTSKKHFASLNLGDYCGDHADSVKVNRELVRSLLGLEQLVFPHQTHGSTVLRVTRKNASQTHEADGLITTEPMIGLGITHADCQAAIFYDTRNDALGVAHAGWKGSAQNIYAAMIKEMHVQLGTQARDLIVCISPSLGSCHAEFKNYKQELPEDFWAYQVEKPHHHFDFWKISRDQLMAAGVPEENIEIAELCSYCNVNDYYSHRKEKDTGRNGTIAGLKK